MNTGINNLIIKLKKYNYSFEIISENEVHVRIVKNICIQVVFTDDGTIIIKDLFKPGNILSGAIRSNMANTILYAIVMFVLLSGLSVLLMYQNTSHILFLTMIIFLSGVLFLIIVTYFTIRIESTKNMITNWTSGL